MRASCFLSSQLTGSKCMSGVVEESCPLHLYILQYVLLGRHAEPYSGPGDVIAAERDVLLV